MHGTHSHAPEEKSGKERKSLATQYVKLQQSPSTESESYATFRRIRFSLFRLISRLEIWPDAALLTMAWEYRPPSTGGESLSIALHIRLTGQLSRSNEFLTADSRK